MNQFGVKIELRRAAGRGRSNASTGSETEIWVVERQYAIEQFELDLEGGKRLYPR